MRIVPVVVLLLAACSKDPLQHDVELLCGIDTRHMSPDQWGPSIEHEAKTDSLRKMMANLRRGDTTVSDLIAWLEDNTKTTGVEHCLALDKLHGR